MTSGFRRAADFAPVIGWELYQVTLDKYHVMFWFEGGLKLLNVAHRFSHRSADNAISYTYRTAYAGGTGGSVRLDRILRERIVHIAIEGPRELALEFGNGDVLVIHDDPRFRSWWFQPCGPEPSTGKVRWSRSDDDGEWD